MTTAEATITELEVITRITPKGSIRTEILTSGSKYGFKNKASDSKGTKNNNQTDNTG